jgi:sugar phosphate isomerase/epimerase
MVNLELSVITDEFSKEFDEVCEYLQQQDVKYVELRNVWVGNIIEIDDQTADDALDILNDCGLKVSALATPLLKCLPPTINPEPKKSTNYTENWQYNYSKIDRAIALAEKFNCKYIRVFAYEGDWAIPPVSEWDNWSIYQEWREAIKRLSQKTNPNNKILICENDSGFNHTLEQIEKIGKDNSTANFGMLFDTNNVVRASGRSGILTDEWIKKISPFIKYIHAKGSIQSGEHFPASPVNAEGDITEWPRLINRFKEMAPSNFIGGAPEPLFFSIETHMGKENTWENSANSLKNLQNIL